MSAATELLVEQIKKTEEAIALARTNGDNAAISVLKKDLKYFQAKLASCNEILNEGASKVLKG